MLLWLADILQLERYLPRIWAWLWRAFGWMVRWPWRLVAATFRASLLLVAVTAALAFIIIFDLRLLRDVYTDFLTWETLRDAAKFIWKGGW